MPIDPQAQTVMDQIAALGLPPRHTLPAVEAREQYKARMALQPPGEAVARVEDVSVPSPAGAIPMRVYTPEGSGPFAGLVYFHGGGWVIGSIDSHDVTARALANAAGCVVASVDYRLAPEHRFPAAAEDSYAATRWLAEQAARFNVDPHRLSVGGDSAGGNLAAVVTLMAKERGGPPLVFQLLIYPVTDCDFETGSYGENATGYLLSRKDMRWFWDHYAPEDHQRHDPHASPLRAQDLHGLPAALVITAEFDPLRDEGEAYARRLSEAGVPTTCSRYDGVFHGFFGMPGLLDKARQAIGESAAALRGATRVGSRQ